MKDLEKFLTPLPSTQIIGRSLDGKEVILQCKHCGSILRVPPERVPMTDCCNPAKVS